MPNIDYLKEQEKIDKLKEKSKEKDEEIEKLEKQYLSKIAKLLVMTQIHCEIKTQINDEFDKLRVNQHVVDNVQNDQGNSNQSFASTKNQKDAVPA